MHKYISAGQCTYCRGMIETDTANTSATAFQKMLSSYMIGKIQNIKISAG